MINESVTMFFFNKNSKFILKKRNKLSIRRIIININKFIKKRNEKSFSEITVNRIKTKFRVIFRRFQTECKFNIYNNHFNNECFNYLI